MKQWSLSFRLTVVVLFLSLAACSEKAEVVPAAPSATELNAPDPVEDPPPPAPDSTPPVAVVNTPPPQVATTNPTVDAKVTEWLTAHNKHRNKKNLPALGWSAELAGVAQKWAATLAAERCGGSEHRPDSFLSPRDLGENLASASASPDPPSRGPTWAVDDWAGEEQFYAYDDNRCQAGQVCGHYTQVVWRSSKEVGCGESSCTDGQWHTKMWVCNYRPAGNVVGQKPY